MYEILCLLTVALVGLQCNASTGKCSILYIYFFLIIFLIIYAAAVLPYDMGACGQMLC